MKSEFVIDQSVAGEYPLGAAATESGMHFSFVYPGKCCAVVLYRSGGKEPLAKFPFPEELRMGDVWSVAIAGDFAGIEYLFEADGQLRSDPCGRQFSGRERWGDLKRTADALRAAALPETEPFDWEGDRPLEIPYEDCIFYHIHPRGFTRHASSGVDPAKRGTFSGILEKIPYLQELGVTTLEMQPPVEFDEVVRPECVDRNPYGDQEHADKLNYWGYAPAQMMAPKAAYSAGVRKAPVREFKELVKGLHRAGLELVIELFFDGKEYPAYVLEVVRFWAREFHVDGVRLVGYAPLKLLGADPYLRRLKLLAAGWDGVDGGAVKHLAECGEGFMLEMRGFLKGDEGKLDSAAFLTRRNPAAVGVVNYMADVNGFTLMDMVSYNGKHNEANGEGNQDGTDYNQSWNCGAEGMTRKKKVLALRRKQLRNAILLLFLSQGTPLLLSGDEFGQTKKGNNNSYCQDNEISWLNWGLLKNNGDIWQFVKTAIAFRKKHPVFHMRQEPALMDYKSCGMPDVSYHGVKAWYPEFDAARRQLGVLYCGAYGETAGGGHDNYFYVAYNMHWTPQEFALPSLPGGLVWHLAADTDDVEHNGFMPEGGEPFLEDQRRLTVQPRSIAVVMGKPGELPAQKEKRGKREKKG